MAASIPAIMQTHEGVPAHYSNLADAHTHILSISEPHFKHDVLHGAVRCVLQTFCPPPSDDSWLHTYTAFPPAPRCMSGRCHLREPFAAAPHFLSHPCSQLTGHLYFRSVCGGGCRTRTVKESELGGSCGAERHQQSSAGHTE